MPYLDRVSFLGTSVVTSLRGSSGVRVDITLKQEGRVSAVCFGYETGLWGYSWSHDPFLLLDANLKFLSELKGINCLMAILFHVSSWLTVEEMRLQNDVSDVSSV